MLLDSVLVRWPDLSEQMIKDVPADKLITLEMKNAGKPAKKIDRDNEDDNLFSGTSASGTGVQASGRSLRRIYP